MKSSNTKLKKLLHNRLVIVGAILVVLLIVLPAWYLYFSPIGSKDESVYLYIDEDDDIDSVKTKIEEVAQPHQMMGFNTLVGCSSYANGISTGRYEVSPYTSSFSLFRRLKNGEQTPVKIHIPSTWTADMAIGKIAPKLMTDSASICKLLHDSAFCAKYELTPNTIVSIFINDTYEVYWNISPDKFIDKMYDFSQRFWNDKRKAKAKEVGLTQLEVMTLASIVDAETGVDAEKPAIAGLYFNRLHQDMLLQSDPTSKFASGKFSANRIKNDITSVDSPYNTYKHKGLPPGPIRVSTISSIDAVLNPDHHDYIFMCAKGDGSRTHNFAKTYEEHQANAKNYYKALDAAGIK